MIGNDIHLEAVRLQMTRIKDILRDHETEARLEWNPMTENYSVMVPIYGPEEADAQFDSEISEDGNTITLFASYISDVLREPLVENRNFSIEAPEEEIYEMVDNFAYDCFMKEHEKMISLEPVNDWNLDKYLEYLPDETITEKGMLAMGISLKDDEGSFPVGAVSFFFTEDELVIHHIFVHDDFRGMGIAIYVVNYIKDKLTDEDRY